MFGYSDEDGTEGAEGYVDKLDQDLIDDRAARGWPTWPKSWSRNAPPSVSARSSGWAGGRVRAGRRRGGPGRARGPEVDGARSGLAGDPAELAKVKVGDLVDAVVVAAERGCGSGGRGLTAVGAAV